MRRRPSSRLLVIDPTGRVLLFRFVHKTGPLAGQDFWATPGGALEPDETFADAAVRELREETGIDLSDLGRPIARREFVLQLPDGEHVAADERFFVADVREQTVSRDRWTALEREVMADIRWWSIEELEQTGDTIWPGDLAGLLRSIGRRSLSVDDLPPKR